MNPLLIFAARGDHTEEFGPLFLTLLYVLGHRTASEPKFRGEGPSGKFTQVAYIWSLN